ncbi:hypothetical protein SKAU_G00185020 [Synaphobranchus kaupii]|uniref:Uncharacterized protein n=1 Tax=Synaphobranchus kaupii TaxID=118154 RepID=A0A9Q1FCX2_SYNKA|nr:hypothetical protein SKAU_G00185020 [Synaphobranchus kaupii]
MRQFTPGPIEKDGATSSAAAILAPTGPPPAPDRPRGRASSSDLAAAPTGERNLCDALNGASCQASPTSAAAAAHGRPPMRLTDSDRRRRKTGLEDKRFAVRYCTRRKSGPPGVGRVSYRRNHGDKARRASRCASNSPSSTARRRFPQCAPLQGLEISNASRTDPKKKPALKNHSGCSFPGRRTTCAKTASRRKQAIGSELCSECVVNPDLGPHIRITLSIVQATEPDVARL